MESGIEGVGVSGLMGLYLWVLAQGLGSRGERLVTWFCAVFWDDFGSDVATSLFGWTYRLTTGTVP